ncbi:unnamed protein product [Staurois parvus]|uniref:Rho-GAP domain-containing protein n=1 Tax=Staurois parvus TaxID=386267 RepID=A0ABN9GBA2_9NEOB|nr:unnamed protein product [Staurois parvus]
MAEFSPSIIPLLCQSFSFHRRFLIKFLAKLAEHQEVNKMTPSNIAIVLGPNLLWARSDGDPSILDMASASPILVVSVVEGLISCSAEVFPGDVDFGVPEEGPSSPQAPSTPQMSGTLPKFESANLPNFSNVAGVSRQYRNRR